VTRALRGPILIPLLLVAVGVLVLLVNFGVLDAQGIWRLAARGWPILIVLLGIDLLLSRASIGHAFGVLVLALVIAAAAVSVVHFAAPSRWIVETIPVREPLPTASTVDVTASCADCVMTVSGGASRDRLIEGSVEVRRVDRLTRTSETAGTRFHLELREEPRLPLSLRSSRDRPTWELRLADGPATTLSLACGRCDVDLTQWNVRTLSVRAAEDASIRLSDVSGGTVYVTAEEVRLEVPADVDVVVEGIGRITDLVVPARYARQGDSVASAGAADVRVVILPGAQRVAIVDVAPTP